MGLPRCDLSAFVILAQLRAQAVSCFLTFLWLKFPVRRCARVVRMAAASPSAIVTALPAAKRTRLVTKTSSWYLALLGSVGGEDAGANQMTYFVTVSRVLLGSAAGYRDLVGMTKDELISMVRDAFDRYVCIYIFIGIYVHLSFCVSSRCIYWRSLVGLWGAQPRQGNGS